MLEELQDIVGEHYGTDFHGALQNDLRALISRGSSSTEAPLSDRSFTDLSEEIYTLLITRLHMDNGHQNFHPHQELSESSDSISVNPRAQY